MSVVIGNLAAISFLAVLIGCWVGYFTDLLPVMVTWLSLGGVLGVAGLVVALLPKPFKEQVQQLFLTRVLGSPRTCKAVVAVFLAMILTTSFFGSVRVVFRPGTDNSGLNVEPAPPGFSKDTVGYRGPSTELPNGVTHNYLRYVPWTGRLYRIRLRPDGGLPSSIMALRPFQRAEIVVPDDFQARRRILLRPSTSVAETVRDNPTYTLRIQIDGHNLAPIMGYRGQAIWVGSDAENVPQELLERWRNLKVSEENIIMWEKPLARPEKLTKKSIVKADLLTEEGSVWISKQTDIAANVSDSLIEEVILDEF